MHEINTYREFTSDESASLKIKRTIRNGIVRGLSFKQKIDNSSNWIQFPYYHHVFDDERSGFERQLKYLKNFGEFISIDEACDLIENKRPINGRFFCLSFDDGFYNCLSNMMPITAAMNIPSIIYLPTNYIGLDIQNSEDYKKINNFYPKKPKPMAFLNWQQCKKMLEHKVSFGSHTCSHANLTRLTPDQIKIELENSKAKIEKELGIECKHFACPFGRPNIEFYPELTLPIAKETGYRSFATTLRGKMKKHDNLLMIKRQHLLSNWGNYQLKYFFGR